MFMGRIMSCNRKFKIVYCTAGAVTRALTLGLPTLKKYEGMEELIGKKWAPP